MHHWFVHELLVDGTRVTYLSNILYVIHIATRIRCLLYFFRCFPFIHDKNQSTGNFYFCGETFDLACLLSRSRSVEQPQCFRAM